MAPGVLKTFRKEFKQETKELLDFEGIKELTNFDKIIETISNLETIEIDLSINEARNLKISPSDYETTSTIQYTFGLDNSVCYFKESEIIA